MAKWLWWSVVAGHILWACWGLAADWLLWSHQQGSISDYLRTHPRAFWLPAVGGLLALAVLAWHLAGLWPFGGHVPGPPPQL